MKLNRSKYNEIMAWMRKHDMLDSITWDGVKWVCMENVAFTRTPVALRCYKHRWGDSFRNKVKFIMKHKGIEE